MTAFPSSAWRTTQETRRASLCSFKDLPLHPKLSPNFVGLEGEMAILGRLSFPQVAMEMQERNKYAMRICKLSNADGHDKTAMERGNNRILY